MEIKNGFLTIKSNNGVYSVSLDKINGYRIKSEDELVRYKTNDPNDMAIIKEAFSKDRRREITQAIIGTILIVGIFKWIPIIISFFHPLEKMYNATSYDNLRKVGLLKRQTSYTLRLHTEDENFDLYESLYKQRLLTIGDAIVEAARNEDNKTVHITYEKRRKLLIDHNNQTEKRLNFK